MLTLFLTSFPVPEPPSMQETLLNAEDDGHCQCIMRTNHEVSEAVNWEMISAFSGKDTFPLYRDYLDNFRIHTGKLVLSKKQTGNAYTIDERGD